MEAILIAPDRKTRSDIHHGRKTITICKGYREIKPGPAMLCCHIEPWAVKVQITNVRQCLLKKVTTEECAADGPNMAELLIDLDMDSFVTIIEWENPEGFFVEYKDTYDTDPGFCYMSITFD